MSIFSPFRCAALVFILTIATTKALAQPANNECINAIPLTNITSWCSASGAFTTIGATPSPQLLPGCFPANFDVHDVWYSFVAQANTVNISVSGTVAINQGGTISNPQFALYSGTCDNLSLLECASDAVNDHVIQSFAGNLLLGQTYYIRVSARFAFRGTFKLCINNYNQVPDPSGDCPSAVILCDKSSFTVPKVIGVGSLNNEIGNVGCNGPSCVITESSSTWYKWTCRDAGTLTFTLTPLNPADDLDFVVYELPGGIDNCNTKNPIRCMASGENVGQPMASWISCTGATGLRTGETDANETCGCPSGNNNFLAPINMVAGRSYALVVNNFSNSGDGFTVDFGGTGTFLGPLPNFTAAPQPACVGQPMTFNDQTTFNGTIVKWTWQFGNQATPAVLNGRGPHSVVFNRPGLQQVLLTVESDRGCLVSKSIPVNVECCPNHFNTTDNIVNIRCANDSTGAITVNPVSAYPPYTYVWNNGTTSSGISNLPAGSYAVEVTDAATCKQNLNFTITQPPPLSADTSIVMPTCNGGTDGAATLIPSGGVGPYQFNWQGSGFTNNNTLSNIPRGDYPVLIRDANNCLLPLLIPVRELELILNPAVQAITPPSCTGFSNGSIIVDISNGAPPFQYNWGAGFLNDNSLLNVSAGTYSVEVRDANLCVGSFNFQMNDYPPLQLGINPLHVSCFGLANGNATVVPSGGVGNYTYLWANGQTQALATGLRAGNYTVTVVDGNGCVANSAVQITEPAPLVIVVIDSTGLLCSYDTTGRIVVQASGGTPDYEYSVNGVTFQSSPLFNTLRSGTYIFTAMDAQGCTATVSGTVSGPPDLIVDAGMDQTIRLGYETSIRAVASQPNLTISWQPPLGLSCVDCLFPFASPAETTTYAITVLNPENCVAVDSVTIFVIKERPIYIPNAFSPNGDGTNDFFTIFTGPALARIQYLKVFDRWGGLVFERYDFPAGRQELGWDGTVRGRPANPGVFTYLASLLFVDGETSIHEGDVTVIR
jgi:gliding motility-associated-like protein